MKKKVTPLSKRVTPAKIERLSACEVFVFGYSLANDTWKGTARMAHEKFGAEIGDGHSGQCYAIPIMRYRPESSYNYIMRFIRYAKRHPQLRFLVTRIGCGKIGFADEDIAPLFADALNVPNITLPIEWFPILLAYTQKERRPLIHGIVTDRLCMELSKKYSYEIGAGLWEYVPDIRVRYVCGTNDFHYTTLANCFFGFDGGLYVWETDRKWADEHNQDLVEATFNDECRRRGFAHRVIFAGVRTPLKDSGGRPIYTGDIVEIDNNGEKLYAAVESYTNGYLFKAGNRPYFFSEFITKGKTLTLVGTVFYQLDWSQEPVLPTERAAEFNLDACEGRQIDNLLTMARYTPNFCQNIKDYLQLSEGDEEFNWRFRD